MSDDRSKSHDAVRMLRFNADGLIPAVVQDAAGGEVLMVAWMNAESLARTIETGEAVYWSRSRRQLWHKGETSGNVQRIREIRTDCDKDVVLLVVEQVGGAACHTGYRSCFSWVLRDDDWAEDGVKVFDPEEKYGKP
ncbi:MAG: phosphoribosyl-AMP cyclohydrolase [Planctomycetes bacterium SM23_25]|nr:MAG: phosphoribosyl-AMP cyclohydrolase [Planctomycetes bacterium SM23_25]